LLLLILWSAALIPAASAQEPLPPELQVPFDSIMQEMRFEKPTRILGGFVMLDPYDNAVWIDWTYRRESGRWMPINGHRQIKVLPGKAGMMDYFKALKPGAVLQLTIQADEDGNRRVLELDEERM
jgi:hypothetical protein